jgi:eukaryotic-like serine/threonine-protein kinase
MTFCPSDERLAQLLEEQLDRRELVDLEQHLESCDHCQGTLEELTRERYSFVEWRTESEMCGHTAEDLDHRLRSRLGRHPSTLPSATGTDLTLETTPEVDGYEILERLGHGGMGVVYKARQHGLERLVALKMIRGGIHAAPEHLARFRIEARAVARLKHPNVVQIYDVGQVDGMPFVALELLEGGSLEHRVASTPQPERPSAELVVILAGAIGAAHRVGVVHRDLKSANVLFATDDTPKIADFGLAKRLDEEDGQTHSGQVMGSPSFMAPEQARGKGREVGPSADLYSLGAILYEMLTGRPPFKGSSAMETLFQVVHDEPLPPTRLRPGLSRDLETICLKCLDKNPLRRYDTAEALANDLQRFLAGSPILARRTSLRERAWKWARRQPAAAGLVVLALATAIGLTVAGLHARQVDQANQQKAEGLRLQGVRILAEGENAIRTKDWNSGLRMLNAFLPEVASNPRLKGLRDELIGLIARIEKGRDEQKKLDEGQERLRDFRNLRRVAQLRDTQFIGVGEFGDVKAIREAAQSALDQFKAKAPGDDPASGPLPDTLTDSEKAEVQQGRYELLLILAEAVSRPTEGEDPQAQADRAIAILDRAARLHPPTRTYHVLKADSLTRKGENAGAEAERAVAETIPTTDAFGHVLRGQELYRTQKWAAAIAEFEKALQLEPEMFRAQLLLAVCRLQSQQPDLARAHLTACLQRQPKAISLYLLRGFASGEHGYQRMKEAHKVKPPLRGLEHDAEVQFEAAEADFETALGLNPTTTERYGLLVNRGALRFRRQQVDNAVKDFQEAIALRPGQVAAYVSLGQAYRQQGRFDAAVEQFTSAIGLKPEMPALYRSRALARLADGRPSPEAIEASLRDFTETIRLERPGSADSAADHARRARLLLRVGRPSEALADAENALRAVPDDPDALIVRVKSLLDLKRFDEVVGAADDALARGKPSAELFELRGLARSNRQEYSGAIQDYTQSLALDPNRPVPLIQRGWAYLVSDATKLALLDFDEAIRIAPNEPDAYNGRGFARVLLGQHQAGVLDAEESLRRGTPDARTHYNAARVYGRAVTAATSEGPRRNLGQIQVAEKYQERAQTLIRQALDLLPAERRADFWRTVVQTDPAFSAIRQRPKFSQLAGQFDRQAK